MNTQKPWFFSLKNSINFPDLATFSVIFSLIYSVNSDANFIIITIITLFIYFYTYLIYHPGVTLNLQKLNINASWFFDAIKFYYFFTAHFQLTKLLLYSAPRLFYEALNNCSRVSFFYDCASHCGFWPNFRCKNYEGNLITIFPKLPEEQMQVSFISHDSGSKGSLTGSKTATNNKIHLHLNHFHVYMLMIFNPSSTLK